MPESLKGVYVVPEQIETWHSGEGRLHDRHRYTKTEDGWKARGVGALTGNAGQVDTVDRRKPRADTLDVVCEALGDLVVRSIRNTGDVGRGNDVVVEDGVRAGFTGSCQKTSRPAPAM